LCPLTEAANDFGSQQSAHIDHILLSIPCYVRCSLVDCDDDVVVAVGRVGQQNRRSALAAKGGDSVVEGSPALIYFDDLVGASEASLEQFHAKCLLVQTYYRLLWIAKNSKFAVLPQPEGFMVETKGKELLDIGYPPLQLQEGVVLLHCPHLGEFFWCKVVFDFVVLVEFAVLMWEKSSLLEFLFWMDDDVGAGQHKVGRDEEACPHNHVTILGKGLDEADNIVRQLHHFLLPHFVELVHLLKKPSLILVDVVVLILP
jgi:hypothetical protein